MKLPPSVGLKKTKAIEQLLEKLQIGEFGSMIFFWFINFKQFKRSPSNLGSGDREGVTL